MAHANISLDGDGDHAERQRGQAEVREEGDQRTADAAVDIAGHGRGSCADANGHHDAPIAKLRHDLARRGRDEERDVANCQRNEVAVGRCTLRMGLLRARANTRSHNDKHARD